MGRETDSFWHSRLPFRCVDAWEEGATLRGKERGHRSNENGHRANTKKLQKCILGLSL